MKKKLITLLLFSFFIFSCNNDDIAEHELSSNHASTLKSKNIKPYTSTLKSSTLQYSLFQNIQRYDGGSEVGVNGEIYCSEATVATFQFGYQGNVSTKYELRMPSSPLITSASGRSVRTYTINLQPGINTFSLTVKFSVTTTSPQYANARLSLISIDNDTSLDAEGYVDLVADGYYEHYDPTGSTPHHMTCSQCGYTLNSVNAPQCAACGK
ncbi:hypothetical protein [Flavobacterium yafengii]|uniref:hypothetical protein n=1 Tax=Flavobacterium yafengii TaxID=3041253 RepID=UPI0024A9686E|nr:hypothetical protein [Flavobacterium yafengii]MDI5899574.1 hypothetical protein [Flavobacterium yafengii]